MVRVCRKNVASAALPECPVVCLCVCVWGVRADVDDCGVYFAPGEEASPQQCDTAHTEKE